MDAMIHVPALCQKWANVRMLGKHPELGYGSIAWLKHISQFLSLLRQCHRASILQQDDRLRVDSHLFPFTASAVPDRKVLSICCLVLTVWLRCWQLFYTYHLLLRLDTHLCPLTWGMRVDSGGIRGLNKQVQVLNLRVGPSWNLEKSKCLGRAPEKKDRRQNARVRLTVSETSRKKRKPCWR